GEPDEVVHPGGSLVRIAADEVLRTVPRNGCVADRIHLERRGCGQDGPPTNEYRMRGAARVLDRGAVHSRAVDQSPSWRPDMTSGSWTHIGYAQEIRFGAGRVAEAPQLIEALRAERVLLVTTHRGSRSAAGKRLAEALGRCLAAVFDDARPHVPRGIAERAFALARAERIDAIVSLGGGSCADLGKAVCHFAEQARGGLAASAFDRPALPHIAVPTTYSGAEVTPFYGMLDEAAHRKSGAAGPTLAPAGVIYDPETTLDLPPRASAETGMNALAHCIEAAWSPSRSPEAEAIAYSGAARIFHALPRVIEQPHDLQARTELLAGALLGGRSLQNASMGVHHGLAQMVGGRTGIAHGLANALILAHAVRF